MRVFLDTNILVSAIVFHGNEFQLVYRAYREGHDIVISEHIMDETMSVMREKFPEHLNEFVEFLNTAEIEPDVTPHGKKS